MPNLALPHWVDPETAFRLLDREHPGAVWSDRSHDLLQPVSFVGVADHEHDLLIDAGSPAPADVVPRLRERVDGGAAGPLGWWGWFSYEAGVTGMGLEARTAAAPGAAFLFARRGLRFDHRLRTVTAVALDGDFRWTACLARAAARPERSDLPAGRWRHRRDAYLVRIEQCVEAIRGGDAYLLCLTNQVRVEVSAALDAGAVYARLQAAAATRFGGVVRIGAWTLISGTPEQFLRVDAGGHATTGPIKGTRRRGTTASEDAALIDQLGASVKERAENLMIVDLMRNDLSQVAVVGSVEVSRLFAVETYPTVHQLVSTVEADLVVDGLDAIAALLPAGSMTGAPKHSAMRILHELEAGPRGVYSGAWGHIGLDGAVDLAVVIRSAVVGPDSVTVGTGGGITALSDAAEEWAEIETKAAPVLAALGSALPTG